MKVSQKGEISTIVAITAIVILGLSTIVTSIFVRDRLSLKPRADADICVNGIVQNSIKLLRADGSVINNGDVINDVTGIQCQARVLGVDRADKFLVCAIRKDNYWPVGCPNGPGDFTQNPPVPGTDVTTTFTKCDRNLLNPPAGHPQLSAGMKLEAVVARFTTGDPAQCMWNDPSKFVAGTYAYFQSQPATPPTATIIPTSGVTPGTTNTPVPTTPPPVTLTPVPGSSRIYISPNPVNINASLIATASASLSCSSYINFSSDGLRNCNQIAGFSCLVPNPVQDGHPCWWTWQCNSSQTIGAYNAVFTAGDDPQTSQNETNPNCTSNLAFSVQNPQITSTPIPTLTSTPNPTQNPTTTITPQPTQIPGDANDDGCVNLLDFEILRREFGQNGTSLLADFNNDNWVNLLDFSILLINFGRCR